MDHKMAEKISLCKLQYKKATPPTKCNSEMLRLWNRNKSDKWTINRTCKNTQLKIN